MNEIEYAAKAIATANNLRIGDVVYKLDESYEAQTIESFKVEHGKLLVHLVAKDSKDSLGWSEAKGLRNTRVEEREWTMAVAAYNECTGVVNSVDVWGNAHQFENPKGQKFIQFMIENFPEIHPVAEINLEVPALRSCGADDEDEMASYHEMMVEASAAEHEADLLNRER